MHGDLPDPIRKVIEEMYEEIRELESCVRCNKDGDSAKNTLTGKRRYRNFLRKTRNKIKRFFRL